MYRNYLQKAEEMLEVAEYAAGESKNNAAVNASVHSAINAIDAYAVFYLGRRHTGGHETAPNAVKGVVNEAEFREFSKQFGGLIALKNEAEYQPDLMKASQARDAVVSIQNPDQGKAEATVKCDTRSEMPRALRAT